MENGRMMKKWKDEKKFNFSYFCLIGNEKLEG